MTTPAPSPTETYFSNPPGSLQDLQQVRTRLNGLIKTAREMQALVHQFTKRTGIEFEYDDEFPYDDDKLAFWVQAINSGFQDYQYLLQTLEPETKMTPEEAELDRTSYWETVGDGARVLQEWIQANGAKLLQVQGLNIKCKGERKQEYKRY